MSTTSDTIDPERANGASGFPEPLQARDRAEAYDIYETGTVEEARAFLRSHGVDIDTDLANARTSLIEFERENGPVQDLPADWEDEFVFECLERYSSTDLFLNPDRDAARDIEAVTQEIPAEFEVFEAETGPDGLPLTITKTDPDTGEKTVEYVGKVVGTRDGNIERLKALAPLTNGKAVDVALERRLAEPENVAWQEWWDGLTVDERNKWHSDPDGYGTPWRPLESEGGTVAVTEDNIVAGIAEEFEGPIPFGRLGARASVTPHVVQDLIPEGQIVALVGEEGDGKSTMGWQIACDASQGKLVAGHFLVPEPVTPVLIIDVEQTEEDAVILRNDMIERGLSGDGVYWLEANGRVFDNPDDVRWLTSYVRAIRPQLIILDTGTEAVTKPREDESVKALFITLHRWLKAEGVRGVLMLAQPRKRAQGEPSGRKFDDLFGSRVWKGRSSAVLYLEQERLTVWKQRGGYLRRRWAGSVGRIVRSDTAPTMILGPQPKGEADEERRNMILNTVSLNPGAFSKSTLLEDGLRISGRTRPEWGATVEALITEGRLHAEGRYRRLFLAEEAPADF